MFYFILFIFFFFFFFWGLVIFVCSCLVCLKGIRSLVSADLMLIDSNMRQQMQTMREAEEEEKKKSLLCLEVVRQHGYQTAFLSCKPLLENGKDIGSVAVQQWGCNATSISCYCCSLSHILKSVTCLRSSRAAAQRLRGQ